jgi:hypothetical protein
MKIRTSTALLYLFILAALLTDLIFLDFSDMQLYEWVKILFLISASSIALFQYYKQRQREI